MSEKTHTPKQTLAEQAAQAAAASRRVFERSSNNQSKLGIGIAAGAISLALVAQIGQNASNQTKQENAAASATARAYDREKVLDEIQTAANNKVDPADIVGMFVINSGDTIDGIGNKIAHSQPEYKNGDENTRKWIDLTINQSGIDQGPYEYGDKFVVSRVVIDGKETLVVQDGTISPDHLQLPITQLDSGGLPAPITR